MIITNIRCLTRPLCRIILRRKHIMSGSDVGSLLERFSTEKFFIEYNGYLSNHLAHGVIALHRLGVPSERIEKFIQLYTPKLETTSYDVIDNRPAEELKGKRVGFYSIMKHFENLLKEKYKNVDDLIKNEYPNVSRGLAGSLLHGTIHLGYGYSVGNEKIILEGLAYTFHSYRPIVSSKSAEELALFGSGTVEITEALKSLRLNKELSALMKEGIKEDRWKELKLGTFQLKVFYLITDHGDQLTDLVLSLAFGPEARHSDGSLDPVKLMRRVVYYTVLVYAKAESRNNFFLLHGVTCAWSLYKIVPLLKKEDGLRAVREYLTNLFAVYVAENASDLTVPLSSGKFAEKDWTELIDKIVEKDRDEHIYKLVQVCFEMAKDAEEHSEDPNVYVTGAKSALGNDLSFINND